MQGDDIHSSNHPSTCFPTTRFPCRSRPHANRCHHGSLLPLRYFEVSHTWLIYKLDHHLGHPGRIWAQITQVIWPVMSLSRSGHGMHQAIEEINSNPPVPHQACHYPLLARAAFTSQGNSLYLNLYLSISWQT